MSDKQWVFNEHGSVSKNILVDGADVKFELRPPTMGDVEDVGVFAYNNPGSELGTLMFTVCQLLTSPEQYTLEKFRTLPAEVGMEVVEGLSLFPVFAQSR